MSVQGHVPFYLITFSNENMGNANNCTNRGGSRFRLKLKDGRLSVGRRLLLAHHCAKRKAYREAGGPVTHGEGQWDSFSGRSSVVVRVGPKHPVTKEKSDRPDSRFHHSSGIFSLVVSQHQKMKSHLLKAALMELQAVRCYLTPA